jgi:hypothetical protein
MAQPPTSTVTGVDSTDPTALPLFCLVVSPKRTTSLPWILTLLEKPVNSVLPLVVPLVTPPAEPASSPLLCGMTLSLSRIALPPA